MKARILHTKFWDDSFILDLASEAKLLFCYLLTNQRVNLIACFELSLGATVFATGIAKEKIIEYLQMFEESGKIRRHGEWVYLVNAHRYQTYSGEKNDAARVKEIRDLPAEIRDWYESVGGITPHHGNGHATVDEARMTPARVASREFLRTLSDEEVAEIAVRTGRNEAGIRYQASKCYDYLKAHGTRGITDYQAYLTTWLTSEYNREDGPAPDLTPVFIKRSVS